MFKKLSAYEKWLSENQEFLIEQWENGITWFGAAIVQDSYEDFVAQMWKFDSWEDDQK